MVMNIILNCIYLLCVRHPIPFVSLLICTNGTKMADLKCQSLPHSLHSEELQSIRISSSVGECFDTWIAHSLAQQSKVPIPAGVPRAAGARDCSGS